LLQRRGSPKLSGPSEEIVPAAHLVRARMTELRRKFLKIADEQGPPHDDVDEWLQNAVEMLRSRELKPRART